MSKIGILTFQRAVNYGACLQAYALKTTIEKKGHDCDVIDYRCPTVDDFYYEKYLPGDGLKTKIKKIITWNVQNKRNEAFRTFVENRLLNGNKSIQKNQLSMIADEYDCYIAGSDQIWSPLCTDGDTTYFLDFVKNKKKCYTYAACAGTFNHTFFERKRIIELLSCFKCISLREEATAKEVRKLVPADTDIRIDVDPTFLLGKREWEEIAIVPEEDNYIFVYSLSMPNEIVDYAKKVSKQTGKRIIYFTLDNLFTMKHLNNVINGSPEEFLGYLLKADYIITNSFHGTAFSIIFNKQFCTMKNSNKNHDNSRLTHILQMLGLEDRLVEADSNCTEIGERIIDFQRVNSQLENLKKVSEKYLENIITEVAER